MTDMDTVRRLIAEIDFKEKLIEMTTAEVAKIKSDLAEVLKGGQ